MICTRKLRHKYRFFISKDVYRKRGFALLFFLDRVFDVDEVCRMGPLAEEANSPPSGWFTPIDKETSFPRVLIMLHGMDSRFLNQLSRVDYELASLAITIGPTKSSTLGS